MNSVIEHLLELPEDKRNEYFEKMSLRQVREVKGIIEEEAYELAENSLYEFVKQGWPHVENCEFTPNWHIEVICEHLEAIAERRIRRLLINIPPRHSKSLVCNVFFPAWLWAKKAQKGTWYGPSTSFILSTYVQSLTLRDSVKNRYLIYSDWFQRRWPVKFQHDSGQKGRFSTTAGGTRLSVSVGGAITGEGFDCFPAGTRISAVSGLIEIERLSVGVPVWSLNVKTRKIEKAKVLAVRWKKVKRLISVSSVLGKHVWCTPEHRFYVSGPGWTQAQDLHEGHILRTFGGEESVSQCGLVREGEVMVYDIQVERNHNFYAEGILVHNCLLIDDPHNATEAESEVERQNVLDWHDGAVSTRESDPRTAVRVYIGQRLHENDLLGHILEKELVEAHLCFPARYEREHPHKSFSPIMDTPDPRTEEGELLWPARFGEAELSRIERQMSVYSVAGQLQQRPAPLEGALLQVDRIELLDELPGDLTFVTRGWDFAGTEESQEQTACYTVGIKMGVIDGDDRVFILDVRRFRAGPERVQEVFLRTCAEDGPQVIQDIPIDPGAAGKYVVSDLRRKARGFSVVASKEQKKKEIRAMPFASDILTGRVAAVSSGEWWNAYANELRLFPNGKFADQVDASSRAYQRVCVMSGRGLDGDPVGFRKLTDELVSNLDKKRQPVFSSRTGYEDVPEDEPAKTAVGWHRESPKITGVKEGI